jgi:hypothetical protein
MGHRRPHHRLKARFQSRINRLAKATTECKTRAASLSVHSDSTTIVIGGRPFSVFGTGEAGMSQSISGDLYATYANHTCYLFETDLALADEQAVAFRV